jgi:diguanylate cyclase (GGDEF)-like protein
MSKQDISSRLQRLRLHLYLLIMSAGVLGYAVNIVVGLFGEADGIQLGLWLGLLIVNCLFIVQLYKSETVNYRAEVAVFTLTSTPLVFGFVATLFFSAYPPKEILLGNGLWFFVIYVFAFLVFSARRALFLSISMSLFSFVLMIIKLQLTPAVVTGEVAITLFNFYLANFFLLVFGFSAASWREYYERTRLEADLSAKQALTDGLTGVSNRRGLEERFEHHVFKTEHHQPLSIVLFDLDHFKTVNDVYGHSAGDEVLREVARLTPLQLRGSDEFGRWGGEEFMVVCLETDMAQARVVAERLRTTIEKASWPVPGVTASFGIATRHDRESLEALYERADRALYEAKRAGRNRVEVAQKTGDGVLH